MYKLKPANTEYYLNRSLEFDQFLEFDHIHYTYEHTKRYSICSLSKNLHLSFLLVYQSTCSIMIIYAATTPFACALNRATIKLNKKTTHCTHLYALLKRGKVFFKHIDAQDKCFIQLYRCR